MDEIDLAEFVQRLKTIHAANVEDTGATAQANSLEAPHEGREALLDRLAKDMFADYMALNIDEIKGALDECKTRYEQELADLREKINAPEIYRKEISSYNHHGINYNVIDYVLESVKSQMNALECVVRN